MGADLAGLCNDTDAKGSWCGFAAVDADGTVLSSAGVASVVQTGTGTYTITLANPMPSTNFPVLVSVHETASTDSIEIHYDVTSPTTIDITIHEGDNGTGANTPRDRPWSFGIPCGDADGVPCDCPDGLTTVQVQALIDASLPSPSNAIPVPDNELDTAIRTGSAGTSLDYARADHNHPIRRQANPGDIVLTAGGNAVITGATLIFDRWSRQEDYIYSTRTQVSQVAGNGWGWIDVPAIAGWQQPKITGIGTYRNDSQAPQTDDGTGTSLDGASPRGPVMSAEVHHWSSTTRLYFAYFRRDEAITSMFVEAVVEYIRI